VGYPTNLSPSAEMPGAKVFFGGLGQITGGLSFGPGFHGILNRHPFPDVVHGCLLEGMALAPEGRFEPFSHERGFITPERVEEIERIAARHGIYLAPFTMPTDQWRTEFHARRSRRDDECLGFSTQSDPHYAVILSTKSDRQFYCVPRTFCISSNSEEKPPFVEQTPTK